MTVSEPLRMISAPFGGADKLRFVLVVAELNMTVPALSLMLIPKW